MEVRLQFPHITKPFDALCICTRGIDFSRLRSYSYLFSDFTKPLTATGQWRNPRRTSLLSSSKIRLPEIPRLEDRQALRLFISRKYY